MPQRKGDPSKPTAVDLDRLEWCFDDCPKDELFDCWRYEFARELGWLRESAAKKKAKKLEELVHATWYSFLLFPRWPKQPYLSIDRSERQRLVRSARPTEAELQAGFLLAHEVPNGVEQFLRTALNQSGRSAIKSKTGRMEIALFKIDWQFPDSLLMQFFKSYLEANRPSEIKPTEHRAKNVPDAQRRQQLRELGMFRLLRANHFNGNATHRVFRTQFGRDGVPLKKVDAWYHAKRNTEALIIDLEAEIRAAFPLLDTLQNGK